MTYDLAQEFERLSKLIRDLAYDSVRIVRDGEDIKSKLIDEAQAQIELLKREMEVLKGSAT